MSSDSRFFVTFLVFLSEFAKMGIHWPPVVRKARSVREEAGTAFKKRRFFRNGLSVMRNRVRVMRKTGRNTFSILTILCALTVFWTSAASIQAEKPDTRRQAAQDTVKKFHLDCPFWRSDSRLVYGESLLFIKDGDQAPLARTIFIPGAQRSLLSVDRSVVYEEGRDYVVKPESRTFELTPETRIPFFNRDELFPQNGAPNSVGPRTDHPDQAILFHNDSFFQKHQAIVDYVPLSREAETPVSAKNESPDRWTGFVPTFAGDRLPKTIARLKAGQPITLAVSGDSISEGYNASAFRTSNIEPFQPSWSGLVAAGLEAFYGSPVNHQNDAISGWNTEAGVNDIPHLLSADPDLVLIAYGMNDVGGRDPAGYQANLKKIIDAVREKNPNAEVILVASMLGNFEWVFIPADMFPVYRDAVKELAAEYPSGVAVADMTAIWTDLETRKTFYDLCGNGVNHPNDFGHRIYAQVVLGLLIEDGFWGSDQ